jgi:O-antigen/teichoic acid export membrane protein
MSEENDGVGGEDQDLPCDEQVDDGLVASPPQLDSNAETASGAATTHSIAQSSVFLIIRRFGILAMSFFSTIVITRKLGPEGYGDLQASLATWGLLLAMCDFGISMALVREMAKNPEEQSALLRATYRVQTLWSIVIAIAMVALGLFAFPGASTHAKILLILAPSVLFSALSSGKSIFRVRYEIGYTVMVDLITTALQVILSVVVALLGFGAVGVAVVISATSIVNSVWIGWEAHRRSRAPLPQSWRPSARKLLRAALPLGSMSMLSGAYLTIDLVILGFMGTSGEIGSYAAAVKVVTLANTLPGLIVNAAMPGVSASIEDHKVSGELVSKLLHWMTAFAFPCFLGVMLYAKPITLILFGHRYLDATSLISILAIAGFVGTVSQLFSVMLIAASKMRPLILQNMIATVFNVVLNIALIPVFGAVACAWLTVATECIVCVGSAWTLFHTMKFRFPAGPAKPAVLVVAASTALGAVLLLVNEILSITAFSAVLLAGLVMTRSWPDEFRPTRLLRARAK